MTRQQLQSFYEQLIATADSMPFELSLGVPVYNQASAHEWATEAESALAAVFPESHPTRQAWARIHKHPKARFVGEVFDQFMGAFKGAYNQIRDNRLASLMDIIRLESESDFLDQATELVEADARAAGAVIAGGVLETHLKNYVDKHGLSFAGSGSISKYNSAVGQARKSNPGQLYSVNDGKLVEAWGGDRNDAAHEPSSFARTRADVKRMIEGIREFIGRTG